MTRQEHEALARNSDVRGETADDDAHGWPLPRRSVLRRGALALGGVAAGWTWGARADAVRADDDEGRTLIVRSRRPLDLESTRAALDHELTPNDRFFVRSHFGAPAVDLGPWTIEVSGLVDRPLHLNLADLSRFDQGSRKAVLQCSGNGRGLFRPRVPGTPWELGAVGQAEWAGPRLADVLRRAGLKEGAAHVHFIGGDAPPTPRAPAFIRSLPLDRALDPGTLLAIRMNGAPLPVLHGGPARLVVPGWTGNNWLKWAHKIIVSNEEAPGFFMQTAYRLAPPAPAGDKDASAPSPSAPVPLTWMNVKSLITAPRDGAAAHDGRQPIEVRGTAWTGQGHVTRVEVRVDRRGPWQLAELADGPTEGSWRRWRFLWRPEGPGKHWLSVRATDSMGQTQPESPPWNKSGYLWNGHDSIVCKVS